MSQLQRFRSRPVVVAGTCGLLIAAATVADTARAASLDLVSGVPTFTAVDLGRSGLSTGSGCFFGRPQYRHTRSVLRISSSSMNRWSDGSARLLGSLPYGSDIRCSLFRLLSAGRRTQVRYGSAATHLARSTIPQSSDGSSAISRRIGRSRT